MPAILESVSVFAHALLQPAMPLGTTSNNNSWLSLDALTTSPVGTAAVFESGSDGVTVTPFRIKIVPICQGPAGSNFSLRLYGWHPSLAPVQVSWVLWTPLLIAEFACTSCNRGGQAGYVVGNDSVYCDTISLTQGSLGGGTGSINSTGPGTDLIAYAIVELSGVRVFQFDFQQTDPVNMNCLFARL